MTYPLRTGLRAGAVAVSLAIALGMAPLAAQAAGLGKLKVYSALGQPLRAEIELNATKDELSGMTARLASQGTFKQAGIDYASTLLGLRFAIDKKDASRPVIRLSSDRPINDPFVDMLLEIDWPAGRLVREYTFLLDPPEISGKAAQVAPVEAKTLPGVAAAEGPAQAKEPRVGKAAPAPRVREKAEKVEKAEPAPAKSAGEPSATHLVKRGETLRQIAAAEQVEGVTLEQMLVGLYRANRDAFDGNNMNRLRAGRILNVPDQATLAAVSPSEAKKVVVAQSADWNAYRRRLAGLAAEGPARDSGVGQAASGKVTARVDDKAAPASEPRDQVRVSRTETAKGKGGKAGAGVAEEDLVAKDKALKDANERLAQLEKNVNDLQKALELKSQNLAELQKQSGAKAQPAPAPSAQAPIKPAAEPAPAPQPQPQPQPQSAAPAATPAPAAAASEPAASATPTPAADTPKAEEKPAEPVAPKVEEAPKPAAPKPVAKPVPPPPPVEEPSLIDDLLGNPTLLAGGGGVLALLLGLVAYRRRKAAQVSHLSETMPMTTSMPSQPSLGANSVFKSTGGQSVDTSNTPVTDFSQAGPGTIDTDEVDPVAEADVYMAYGRDAQAEEILIEALQKDPKRTAIHLKLLEIYSNRKSLKQFETLASELYAVTGGSGGDWDKAAAMGAKLDPNNPLFAAVQGGHAAAPADKPAASPASAPLQAAGTAAAAGVAALALGEVFGAEPTEATAKAKGDNSLADLLASHGADAATLDFDLGNVLNAGADPVAKPELEPLPDLVLPEPVAEAPAPAATAAADDDGPVAAQEAPKSDLESTMTLPDPGAVEFSLDDSFSSAETAVQTPAALEHDDNGLDFELDLGDAGLALDAPSAAPAASVPAAQPQLEEAEELPAVAPLEVAEPAPEEPAVPAAPDASATDDSGLEFDVQLTESTVLGDALQARSFDLSSISLDLDQPGQPGQPDEAAAAAAPAPEATVIMAPADSAIDFGSESSNVPLDLPPEQPADGDSRWQEVATKLDLAKAYEEMGDVEGAKELLQEVLAEGDATQQEQARAIIGRIGS